jgi:hypothetical protein
MAPSALLPDPEPEYIIVHAGKGTIKRQILTGDKKKPTFESITEVDFSNMDSPSFDQRKAVAKEVGAAFRNSGFLYAKNHGIPEDLQEELYRVIRGFFDLPLGEKMKVSKGLGGYKTLKADQKQRFMSINRKPSRATRLC